MLDLILTTIFILGFSSLFVLPFAILNKFLGNSKIINKIANKLF